MENDQKKNPIKPEYNRKKDGKFGPNNNANPNGRPVGTSLKEYWRQRFAAMTPEEKEKFTRKVSPELLWQMAEGRPKQDITSNDQAIIPAPIYIPRDNGTSSDSTNENENTSSAGGHIGEQDD